MKKVRSQERGVRSKRQKLLAALFAETKKKGIDAEFLRDVVSQNIISKRLSEATPQELVKVLEHITQDTRLKTQDSRQSYESSKTGLLQELEDIARARWGEGFQSSLNAFVNSHRQTPTHYRFLPVTDMKAVKERIREMNKNEVA